MPASASQKPKYRRIVLKISGEALRNDTTGASIDSAVLDRLAEELRSIQKVGTQVAVVVGGGNIFRGLGADLLDRAELFGEAVEDRAIDGGAGRVITQGFAADLQHDTTVLRLLGGGGGHTGEMSLRIPSVNPALVSLDSDP